MSNKCEMCWEADDPSCEVKDGDYTLKVCLKCKQAYQQKKVYDRIQPLVEQLCKELNGGDKNQVAQALLDSVNREHRYLQSELFNALWRFFTLYSKQDYDKWFDGRNIHCRDMAEKWDKAI